jgi:hypothetical protein
MSTNDNGYSAKPKAKRAKGKRPKFSALFLLGSDGEVYACCPMPSPPPVLACKADIIMAIKLDRRERDILLDVVHTEGVIEAAKTLAGILRPHA